ncbi:MAG: hypothetical protein Q9163_001872 [Psora crenata]
MVGEFPAVEGGGSLILAWQIRNKQVLVVGGGEVAAGRILNVLNADAKVTVVSPRERLNPEVAYRIDLGQVIYHDRKFEPSDLDDKDMVLTAIDDPEASTIIWKLCKERKLAANIADVPSECDFYFGSVHRDGPLQIMVSTNGNGPKLASMVRKQIANSLPSDIGDAIKKVGTLRRKLRKVAPDVNEGPKRMQWMSAVCEQWSLEELVEMDEGDMERLLSFYIPGTVPTLAEIAKATSVPLSSPSTKPPPTYTCLDRWKQATMALPASQLSEHPFRLLALPGEVRNEIYRHLVTAARTLCEVKEERVQYKVKRTYSYRFHLSIHRVNRQIHDEASHILGIKNAFISVTTRYTKLLTVCKQRLPVVAGNISKMTSSNWVMTVDFNSIPHLQPIDYPVETITEDFSEVQFLISAYDLSYFCKVLLYYGSSKANCPQYFSASRLTIKVLPLPKDQGYTHARLGSVHFPITHDRILLEPFRVLHSIGKVQIHGPVSPQYKAELMTSISRLGPSVEDIIYAASALQEQADNAIIQGRPSNAMALYKRAIEIFLQSHRLTERSKIIRAGEHAGKKAIYTSYEIGFELVMRIATLYHISKKYQLAHEVADGAFQSAFSSNKTRRGRLRIAVALYQCALASEGLGYFSKAQEQLYEALECDPGNIIYKVKSTA